MGIRILKGGMLTTVQDSGRPGYQSQGFGVSGVMDRRSFKIANLLLDNPENEAVLEFTLLGPTLEFTSETIIAITGGDFQPQVNGKPVKMYTALYMHRGDILSFRGCRTGSRGYIAFSSYLEIPVVMGSRSTNIKCGLGGFKGRRLLDGDYISFRAKRRYRTVGARAIRARGSAYLVLWTAAPSKLPIFFWIIRKMKQFSNSLFLDQHWNLLPRRSSLSREVIFSHRSMESL